MTKKAASKAKEVVQEPVEAVEPVSKAIVKVAEKRLRAVSTGTTIPKTTASHVGIITKFTRMSDSTKVNIVNIMKGFIKEEVLKSVAKMQDNRTTLMERDI